MSFEALVTRMSDTEGVASRVETLPEDALPAGNVVVDVEWSGLNYKDALCLTGAGGLVRDYPHVSGIDFAGTVRSSEDGRYNAGDRVVLTGWRVGETHWGGYAQQARVDADWLVPLPEGISTRDAMMVGTAGLTAMLAIGRLKALGVERNSEILVTGAGGGVGSIAVLLLSRLGYQPVALSGRPELAAALRLLGAAEIIGREAFLEAADKPLEPARWSGAIDTVGGQLLSKVVRQMKYDGVVAAVGNAGGITLDTNVLPFILRGVTLTGIDSVMQPFEKRVDAWNRIVETFDREAYAGMTEEIELANVPDAADRILKGLVRGRMVIRV